MVWALWATLLASVLAVAVARLLTEKPAPLVVPFLFALGLIALLMRHGKLRWAAHSLSILIGLTTVAMTFIAGELIPILHALAIIPLFTTLVAGVRAGFVWCLASLALLALAALGVDYLPLPDPSGRGLPGLSVAVVTCIVFTLTWAFERSRRQAITALQERDSASQTLFRLLPDEVLRIDEEGQVLQRSTTERFSDDLLDALFRTDESRRAVGQAISANAEREFAHHIKGKALSVRLIPLAQDELLALVRDRSDAERLEERATKAELIASLERANRMSSIGVLAACIAHEVNNPLAYLAGNLEFLKERAKREEASGDRKSAIDDAINATDRVRSIVAELKHYSREDTESPKALRPSMIVEEALKIVRNETRHIADVATVFEHGRARVSAAPTRLVQVVVNLLLNAAQALPRDRKQRNTIEVRTSRSDDTVDITVVDNGPGIPQELLERVTQPFFTTKNPGVGTGLGLAVCEEIIRQADGALVIENIVGGGASITVQLPIAEQSETTSSDFPATRMECCTRSGRILVIDDEPLVRRALMRLLREHEVVEAAGGEEALALLKSDDAFDLILCDVMMPVLSGLDVYERVRQDFTNLEDRVVFMTGGAFDPRLRALMQAAASVPVIDKPFDSEHLRQTVGNVIAATPR